MFLACAIAQCEDEMICDLAETYHIYNYRALEVQLLSTLLFGLSENSRTKMYLSGNKLEVNTILLSIIADHLGFISWSKTKEAQKGQKKPKSILESLMNEKKESDIKTFANGQEFDEMWESLTKG